MKVIVIAQVAHAINAAYCLSLGDASQVTWEDAPEWQRQSAVAGVEMHLANPDATPEQSHESWLAQKLADGWAYGEVKDAEKKLHPCCRPYAELPPEQKAKDYLFRGAVHALKNLPDVDEAVATAVAETLAKKPATIPALPPSVVLVGGQIAVQYIGRKETYADHLYGTGLSFEKDQVRGLPTDIARKFLRHGDMFKECGEGAAVAEPVKPLEQDDTAKTLDEAAARQKEDRAREDALLDLKQHVSNMTKNALCDYALTNYRQKLDSRASVADLRQQVTGMIDQFGAV